MLQEVFIKEQYKIDLDITPQTIVDIGSNVGLSVVYFVLKYPEASIYAFEPDPVTYKKLLRNVSGLTNVRTFNLAIGDTDGPVNFYVHPESSMSSSFTDRTHSKKPISVYSKKLDTFLYEQKITKVDLIKFDAEGAEYRIFSCFDKIERVVAFVGELHIDIVGVTEEQFMSYFGGYTCQKIVISPARYLLKFKSKSHERTG